MNLDLEGRTVIVTGGTRGIGKGISIGLLEEGANVVVVYHSDIDSARKFLDESVDYIEKIVPVQADVTLQEGRERMVEHAIKRFGAIYGLVNCAGIEITDTESEKEERALHMANLNGIAPVELTNLVAQQINPAVGGSVVNILSVKKDFYVPTKGELPMASVHYCASKGYLEAAMKGMSGALRKRNIRINAVSPGPTIGGGNSKSSATHDERFRRGQYGMNRRGEIDDVVYAVLFLLSPKASHIVGHTLDVSGGQKNSPFYYPLQKS